MIEIENVQIYGWEAALRGMRNPLNSWAKSDTNWEKFYSQKNDISRCIGENDLSLMKRLAKAGTDHRKYLRMINVTVDITAPLYWWLEYDTYKVGTVANSCSKMHKLLEKPFEMNDFSFDKLSGYKNEVKQFRPKIDEEMVAKETWKQFDDDYSISNYGRVKHILSDHYRIIGGSVHQDGYIFVTIKGKQYPLHRLVAKLFHSDTYKGGLVVNHMDGNKMNNFADNLEWVTQSENINHSYANNFQPKNNSTYKGKFTQEQRNEIKRLWNDGVLSKRKIAEQYGVSHTCICDIINDKYAYFNSINLFEEVARPLVDALNELRDLYLSTEDKDVKKDLWYSIIQLLPESYNQKRTVQLNYEVLYNMYKSRKEHKLDEWRFFCSNFVLKLPYFTEIFDIEV